MDSANETRESVSDLLVKIKSKFYSPHNRSKFLDTTIHVINSQNLSNLSEYKTNLSKEDWQAFKELKNDESIFKKEMDEGGAVVKIDSVDYEQRIYKQLENKNT